MAMSNSGKSSSMSGRHWRNHHTLGLNVLVSSGLVSALNGGLISPLGK